METFGERLSELRTRRKLSQADLSAQLNLAKSTLSMYETNHREPNFEVVQKFADFFSVSVDYLLGRANSSLDAELSGEDAELGLWFKDLKNAPPSIREETKRFFDFLQQQEAARRPGDKQGE